MAAVYVIPNPQGLTWGLWAATTVGYNPTFGQYLHPNMDWKDFGRKVAYLVPQAPRPDLFETWQQWASELKLVLAS